MVPSNVCACVCLHSNRCCLHLRCTAQHTARVLCLQLAVRFPSHLGGSCALLSFLSLSEMMDGPDHLQVDVSIHLSPRLSFFLSFFLSAFRDPCAAYHTTKWCNVHKSMYLFTYRHDCFSAFFLTYFIVLLSYLSCLEEGAGPAHPGAGPVLPPAGFHRRRRHTGHRQP